MSLFLSKLRRLISFTVPMVVERRHSALSGALEIVMYRGKCRLDAPDANYSYGSLHRVFRKAFRLAGLEVAGFSHVLILGYGAGSVDAILREEYGFKGIIHGIEADEVVIELFERYFLPEKHLPPKIFRMDAFEFLRTNQHTYDLIVVDLYVNKDVPPVFESAEFIGLLTGAMSKGSSRLFFNKMVYNLQSRESAGALAAKLREKMNAFDILEIGEGYSNWVMVGEKG